VNEESVDYEPEDIGKLFRAMGMLHDRMVADIEDLRQRTATLEDQARGFRSDMVDVESWLDRLRSEYTQDRGDLHSEAHIAHLGLASDYRSLVMQWLQRLARKLGQASGQRSSGRALELRVASFSDYLFRGQEADVRGLLGSLGDVDSKIHEIAESVCIRASSLREKIADIGIQHEWDFRAEVSGELDDERQEVWFTCDPSRPISIVVAPAYVVQGMVYARQLVGTGEARSERVISRRNT
jgi:hypothetical protein